MQKDNILKIYNFKNSVFSIEDIALIWQESNRDLVKKRIYRYVKANKLYALRRGLYSKSKEYNKFELGIKIYNPSYISFETVLAQAGVVFQHYSQIFIASYLSREIEVKKQKYMYKKINGEILTNNLGVECRDEYYIATPERAFLDTLYLNKNYHFDNLSVLDKNKIFQILPIYKNKRMNKDVDNYFKNK